MNTGMARGLSSVLFPDVCVCCWREAVSRHRPVCPFCLEGRFEKANAEWRTSTGGVLLPAGISLQYAHWKFDKGGALQELLHRIKYERMSPVALQLGECLGAGMRRHPRLAKRAGRYGDRILLLPVPLHPVRYRLRGFNQAERIARGIRRSWKLPVAPQGSVVRLRNTPSQTGMALKTRVANMKNAFDVRAAELIRGRMVLMVDDVFTTGATVFALADVLNRAGAAECAVMTVAQA